ncbi:ABC transporter ATP-binding protein [Porticoccaceae bacterium]|jgi:lipoprotein-releasing system ATP-binding protein|nr:ABC transporter ATP-binding protein [Porticoccaceae bacterium]MDC0134114.1 ABC transporter ATP-binding protein [Porticoccaceae bacterium]MDC1476551.1 ABC transporter ATP-binding protein [Porticoccaceae bacterium]CAI8311141.1 MAG: Lipoprotein-releasing system ATP-binding protein LolD [SAR92 bacterium MED-G29]|tara:strand:- start:9170 stop:9859 length:690 start_codon:yes stop_codon:yes gene_type:complete
MTSKPVLVARDLARSYEQAGNDLSVLQGINLEIEKGEKLAIIGVSGSGKTTLLNVLGGLDDPNAGSVVVCDRDWQGLDASERAAWRNQHVGFVYQFHHLLAEFSALENVALPLLIGGVSVKESRQRATDLLTRVGLGERLQHRPAALSGGERQRVAIARALVTQPSVVLMDEPTGNLDPHTAASMLDLLMELNETLGISFIMVTHDPAIAARMDRTVCLVDGRLEPVVV